MATAAGSTDGLNDRQRAFVHAYCDCLNATRAAIAAGYSPRTAYAMGHENLSKPAIRAAINKRLAERKMGGEEVIARLEQHATGTMADFLSTVEVEITTGRGESAKTEKIKRTVLDLEKAERLGVLHLLRDFKVDGRTGAVSIRLYDSQRALALLGRHHGVLGKTEDRDDDDGADEGGDDLDGGIGDDEIRTEADLGGF